MGFLLQNINVIKAVKKRIDTEGASLLNNSDMFFTFHLDSFSYITPVLSSWKTVIIDVNEDAFYIGLDLNGSFDYKLSTTLPSLKLSELKKLVEYDKSTKYFNLKENSNTFMPLDSNLEKAYKILGNAILDYSRVGFRLKNLSYRFLMGNCSPSAENILKGYLKFDNIKYLPLFLITTAKKYNEYSNIQAMAVSLGHGTRQSSPYTWYPLPPIESFLRSVSESNNFITLEYIGTHLMYNPGSSFIVMS